MSIFIMVVKHVNIVMSSYIRSNDGYESLKCAYKKAKHKLVSSRCGTAFWQALPNLILIYIIKRYYLTSNASRSFIMS